MQDDQQVYFAKYWSKQKCYIFHSRRKSPGKQQVEHNKITTAVE